MGLSVLNQPAAAGGGIKSVQRGSAAGAGNVTITSVDITKSFVTVFGTTSSGTVAASGTINADSGNISAMSGTVGGNVSVGNVSGGTLINWAAGSHAGVSNTFGYQNAPNQILNDAQGVFGYLKAQNLNTNATSYSGGATNLTGGSNNLVAAVVQGYLSNSTTLVVSGACRWEVVEFN